MEESRCHLFSTVAEQEGAECEDSEKESNPTNHLYQCMIPLMKLRRFFEKKRNYYTKDPEIHIDVLQQRDSPYKSQFLPSEFYSHIENPENHSTELIKSWTTGSVQVPRAFINNNRINDPKVILRKYLLLHDDTPARDTGKAVFNLLRNVWKLEHPTLVISIITGSVDDETKLQAVLDNLHQLCVKHKTWIISDGMHNRASRMVAQSFSKTDQVKLIGFPKWSSLGEEKALLYGPSFEGYYDSYYFVYNENKLKSCDSADTANPYQDVYLFEDDTKGSSLRESFVHYLHGQIDQTELPISCVSLVIGGNKYETLEIIGEIERSLKQELPVVIVTSSSHLPTTAKKIYMELENGEQIADNEENCEQWKAVMEYKMFMTFIDMEESHNYHTSTFIDGILKQKDHGKCMLVALRANSIEFLNAVITRQSKENSEFGHHHVTIKGLEELYETTLNIGHKETDQGAQSKDDQTHPEIQRMRCILFDDIDKDKPVLPNISLTLSKVTEWRYAFKYQPKKNLEGLFSKLETQIWYIFIYAILCNRSIEIVMHLGSLTESPLGAFIFAYSLYRKLSLRAMNLTDMHLGATFQNNADHCIQVASAMIEKMYNESGDNAHKSLKKELPFRLGNRVTALSLAGDSNAKAFMGTTCCSKMIRDVWFSKIPSNLLRCMVALLFPPLVFRFLKFGNVSLVEKFHKVRKFYCAPVNKFIVDFAAYLGFLLLFSRFLLSDLQPVNSYSEMNVTEWLTYCIVCAKILEEFKQIYDVPGDQFKDIDSKKNGLNLGQNLYLKLKLFKLNHYFTSGAMNTLDCTMLTLFVISVICRFTLPYIYFQLVRIMFCCSLILFYARILRFLYVIEQIGPRVIAITLMLNELAKMCLILLVFIVAFGVAFQALMSPGQSHSWKEIADLLYRPYWQMYGEIFLDDASTGMGREVGSYSCTYLKAHGQPELHCFSAFPYILIALYLVVSNVLLLNFVIAIFGRTLSEAEDKSKVLWAYEQYVLTREYYYKSLLPVPFNLLWFPFSLVLSIAKKKCSLDEQEDDFFTPQNKTDDAKELKEFQYQIYLKVKAARQSSSPVKESHSSQS